MILGPDLHLRRLGKTQNTGLQGFVDAVLKLATKADLERSMRVQRVTSSRLTRRSPTSMVNPTPTSQRISRSSLPERSWQFHLPPLST
jgi:hypothetical protein